MAHLSELENKLSLKTMDSLSDVTKSIEDVYYVKYPYYTSLINIPDLDTIIDNLNSFIEKTGENAVISILSSPLFAAEFLSQLTDKAYFKLWIGVKLETINHTTKHQLPQQHAALVIVTRYKDALKHAKTRIAYTFCPFCEKTTKDYGGKKHLYHEYGTLMSDVWRDISINYNNDELIIDRLRDIFGISPYKELKYIDLTDKQRLESSIPENSDITVKEINIFNYKGNINSAIINDDCLKVLKEIPSNSVDFCFADPPYNVDKKYDNCKDNLDITRYYQWCDQWLTELARIIKPGRTVAILNIPQRAISHYKCLSRLLKFQDWIIWEGLSVPVRMIMPAHYSILCFTKGEANDLPFYNLTHSALETESIKTYKEFYCTRNSCVKKRREENVEDKTDITNLWWDIHRLKHNSQRVDHPTQLPPMFMERLISIFTNKGDLVLDPFNGSGTTSLCAEILGRKFFGIELSPQYYDIAVKRHLALQAGINPFGKHTETPNAKNSRVERLKKQKYEIDKKTLQLDVKRISLLLNRMPTREDVISHSKYPIKYYDDYFINWGEVTAAARTTGMQNVENKKDYEAIVKNRDNKN